MIQTLLEQAPLFRDRYNLNLSICGAINKDKTILGADISSKLMAKLSVFQRVTSDDGDNLIAMTITPSTMSLEDMASAMNGPGEKSLAKKADLEKFFHHISTASASPHCICIDCTNSQFVGSLRPAWLRSKSMYGS